MKEIKSCGITPAENIYFDWHLTNWCNYKCSYCPVLNVITNDFTKDDHAPYKIVLARLTNVEITFNVCITGGEPTLHPNLIEILQGLVNNNNCQDIALFTNLSRPTPFYEKIKNINSNKIVVFASYHPEFATDKFTERCIEVNNINGLRFSVHVTLSDNKEHWDATIKTLDTLRGNGVNCKPLLLSPNGNYTPNYTDEFYNVFYKYLEDTDDETFFLDVPVEYTDGTKELIKSYDIDRMGLNKFKGYRCTPASYSISIDGKIENTCTRRTAPLLLNNKNLLVEETCPHDICPSRRLLEFYKQK